MAFNRYIKSGQITEEQFIGIVYDYVLGATYTACAKRVGISKETARNRFEQLRAIVVNHPVASAGFCWLPKSNDPFWRELKRCIYSCPSCTEKNDEIEPHKDQFRFGRVVKLGHKVRTSIKSCEGCAIKVYDRLPWPMVRYFQISFDENITDEILRNRYIEYFALQSVAAISLPKLDRTSGAFRGQPREIQTVNNKVQVLLHICEENPL